MSKTLIDFLQNKFEYNVLHYTVCLKKSATYIPYISSNISLVTKDIYSKFSLLSRVLAREKNQISRKP
jgi:hypothetical protein